ncbi:MAG: DUF2130 domain-containing protein [Candidatus Kapaibacterium sp.]
MSTSSILSCPNCGSDLTEALSKQVRESIEAEFEQKLLAQKHAVEEQTKRREEAFAKQLAVLQEEKLQQQREVSERERERQKQHEDDLRQQAESVRAEEAKKAAEAVSAQLSAREEEIVRMRERIDVQNAKEAELLQQQRKLEDERQEMEVRIQRTLSEERTKIWENAQQQVSEQYQLKDAEKDKQLADLRKALAEMERRASQGSQQMQGEVLENLLEEQLAKTFVFDSITEVPKGVKGADIVQTVRDQHRDCGLILWEIKRTKTWSNEYIPKLKADMRELHAHVGIIATTSLPKGVETFAMVDGVWVSDIRYALQLSSALREGIIDVARQRVANEGKSDKMELLYDYLTGQQFAQHIQSIMEVIITMRKELESEKAAYERIWAKREKQIERTRKAAVRIHGELEGIMGQTLSSSSLLALPDAPQDDE